MPRTDAYPRAKALVQAAALDNPSLTGAEAHRMLVKLQEREEIAVAKGEKLAQDGLVPLEIPANAKSCTRWINKLPEFKTWDGETATPAEFQIVGRVFYRLTATKFINRMFSQDEAERIARYGMIVPSLSPTKLWGLARAAIIMEANNIPLDSLNAWLMYNVPPQREQRGNTLDKRMSIYRRSVGKLFPEFPDIHMTLTEMDEQPVPNKNLVSDTKGTE